jgi:hypothetical protein
MAPADATRPLGTAARPGARAAGLLVLALVSACSAGPSRQVLLQHHNRPGEIGAAQAKAILHRYDFPEVKELKRAGHRWDAMAYRDGSWMPVEVFDNGTLVVRQYG